MHTPSQDDSKTYIIEQGVKYEMLSSLESIEIKLTTIDFKKNAAIIFLI